MLSRADIVATALLAAPAILIVAAYGFDRLRLGIVPAISALLAALATIAVLSMVRRARADRLELITFSVTLLGATGLLLWAGRPHYLPGGSGPDLTHHLMLVDYIQRHGTLVHDVNAWRQLGEMANYTPGLHVLAVISGVLTGSDGFFVVYPIVAVSVALKVAFAALIAFRLAPARRLRLPMVIVSAAALLSLPSLTLSSFTHDSFLAQVISEVFAVAMLWALVAWSSHPSGWLMAVFGVAGAAGFLTWPLWIGPLLLALLLTVAAATHASMRTRAAHIAIAVAPIAIVALLHTIGRVDAIAIVGTSGAVAPPSFSPADWWLPVLALAGLAIALRQPNARPIAFLAGGLAAQAAVLWGIARWNGAGTPYMAIKMAYLAIYPGAFAAALAVAALARRSAIAWAAAIVMAAVAVNAIQRTEPSPRVVDADLYDAGLWARDHLPAACVDYLVANEYTAYWLHLAVLGNERMTERSADDGLYLTAPSFARWVQDTASPRYAIAKQSVLPVEIRERTRVLYQRGDATVIERQGPTRARADGTCGDSRTTAVP